MVRAMKEEIGREIITSTYVLSKEDHTKDAVYIKERIHYNDKTNKDVFRPIINFQKPFYIVKKEYRDYKEKKEYEHIGVLDEYFSNQACLSTAIDKVLNGGFSTGYKRLPIVLRSPYVYGADIEPAGLIVKEYKDKWPDAVSEARLAVLDYEWDVVEGTDAIISGILSFKDRVHMAASKTWLKELSITAEADIIKACNLHLKEYIDSRNITLTVTICDNEAEVVKTLMASAHEWGPDFIGLWNIKSDFQHMERALKRYGVNPAFIFSDPSVTNEFKHYVFKEDEPIKTKGNGTTSKKHIADLWHTVDTPAKFKFVCLMALFRFVRAKKQQRRNYKLDPILHEFLKIGKIFFDYIPASKSDLERHKIMQTKYKIEYMVYLFGDGVFVEMLDEKTRDVSLFLKNTIDINGIHKIKSNPRCLANSLYFKWKKKNYIIASTSDNMTEELDKELPSAKGWIITAASELTHKIGKNLIKEYPDKETNITVYASDIDVGSAYPLGQVALNESKTTRVYELCSIPGLTPHQIRSIAVNMTSVKSNAISLAQLTYGFPLLNNLLEDFKEELKK